MSESTERSGARPTDDAARDAALDLLARAAWTRGLARRLVRDAAAADELLQETWLALLSRPRAALEAARSRGFLGAVLRNRARETGRADRARERRERAAARGEALPSAERLLSAFESQRVLAAAVERLEEPYRRTVLLRWFEGLSLDEIARREGSPAATVRTRHRRALERLRADLERDLGGARGLTRALLPAAGPPLGRAALSVGGILVAKKLVLASAAVLCAALVLVARREEPAPPERGRAAELALELATPEAPADAAPAARGARDAAPADAADPEPPRAAARRSPAAPPAVSGRVLPAPGAPPDDDARVYALDRPTSYAALVRRIHDDGPADSWTRSVPVAEDGSFAFAATDLPAGARERVHLSLRGRHAWLADSVEVELGPGAPEVLLAARCGALLRGRVRGPSGAPAADAVVDFDSRAAVAELPARPGPPGAPSGIHAEVRTDAEGRFEVRAVPPGEGGTLFVLPRDLAPLLRDTGPLAECATAELDLAAPAGGAVAGAVVDDAGAPVAGARVTASLRGRSMGFDDRELRSAASDERGRFRLDALPPGEVVLRASRAGLLESERTPVAIADGGAAADTVLALARGAVLAGRALFADGAPAAGARVDARFDPGFAVGPAAFGALRGARGSAVAADDGTFEVGGLGPGPFRVRASAERDGATCVAALDAVRPRGELALVLAPPAALRGAVTGPGGEPAPGAAVVALRIAPGAVGETVTDRRAAAAGADGAFELPDLAPGTWRVRARAPGRAPSEDVELALPDGARELALALAVPARVAGVVVAPDGATVSGAVVSTGDAGPALLSGRDGDALPTAVTDERGRFELAELRPGELALVARADGFASSEALPLAVAAGEERAGLRLELRRGARLTGRVFGEGGRPDAGCTVNLVRWNAGGTFAVRLATADGEGRFAFEGVDPGTWQVVAVAGGADLSPTDEGSTLTRFGQHVRAVQVALRDGDDETVVLGDPARRPVAVRGRVLRGAEPYPDVLVSFTRKDGSGRSALASVDEGARYSVEVDGGGAYAVDLMRLGGSRGELSTVRVDVAVPDAPRADLDLDYPAGAIAGRVAGPDGRPAADARVTLLPGRGAPAAQVLACAYAEVATDGEGRFELLGLVPGTYRLAAGGARFGAAAEHPARAALDGLVLEPGERLDGVELRLPEACEVALLVLDAAGLPAAGATVFARGADGELLDPVSAATTDAAGRIAYAGLPPEDLTFFALRGEEASLESGTVAARPGSRPEVTLALEPAAVLWVRTLDGDGEPCAAAVSLTDADGRSAGAGVPLAELAELGPALAPGAERRRFGPLPPGRYRATAEAPDGRSATRSVELSRPGERTLVLRLD